jgi:hypothetical protein
MAETWVGDGLGGAQSADVNVYQAVINQTYQNTGIIDLNGESRDLGAPQMGTARLTVTTLTGTTPKLDAKLQHRPASTDSWVDVTNGAFTQATAAGTEALAVVLHRFVRVVTNFTDTITVSDFNVKLTLKN